MANNYYNIRFFLQISGTTVLVAGSAHSASLR